MKKRKPMPVQVVVKPLPSRKPCKGCGEFFTPTTHQQTGCSPEHEALGAELAKEGAQAVKYIHEFLANNRETYRGDLARALRDMPRPVPRRRGRREWANIEDEDPFDEGPDDLLP